MPDELTLATFLTIRRLYQIQQSTLKRLSTIDNTEGHLPSTQLNHRFQFDILIEVVRHSALSISSKILLVSPRHFFTSDLTYFARTV